MPQCYVTLMYGYTTTNHMWYNDIILTKSIKIYFDQTPTRNIAATIIMSTNYPDRRPASVLVSSELPPSLTQPLLPRPCTRRWHDNHPKWKGRATREAHKTSFAIEQSIGSYGAWRCNTSNIVDNSYYVMWCFVWLNNNWIIDKIRQLTCTNSVLCTLIFKSELF